MWPLESTTKILCFGGNWELGFDSHWITKESELISNASNQLIFELGPWSLRQGDVPNSLCNKVSRMKEPPQR